MSYITWGANEYEINEDIILKIAPVELTAFKNALDEADFTLDGWAKYISSYKQDADQYLNDGQDDLNACITTVEAAYKDLQKVLLQQNIELGLFAPLAEVESGEDRGYWTVENAFIKNPNINENIFKSITSIDVVQGG